MSPAEKEEFIAGLGTSQWAWTRREFAHWLTHSSAAKFDGTGDAYTLAEWDSALRGYFRREQIGNEAKRSALAIVTFKGKAERWWNAYMEQFPHRLLSYAQLLEMMKTELVEKADPTTALQAWLQLEYHGKPEAYLKQMDNLMMRFPISPDSLLEMATTPLGHQFAAQMREADHRIPGVRLTYPHLRKNIANYLQTLVPPTSSAHPRFRPREGQHRLQMVQVTPIEPSDKSRPGMKRGEDKKGVDSVSQERNQKEGKKAGAVRKACVDEFGGLYSRGDHIPQQGNRARLSGGRGWRVREWGSRVWGQRMGGNSRR